MCVYVCVFVCMCICVCSATEDHIPKKPDHIRAGGTDRADLRGHGWPHSEHCVELRPAHLQRGRTGAGLGRIAGKLRVQGPALVRAGSSVVCWCAIWTKCSIQSRSIACYYSRAEAGVIYEIDSSWPPVFDMRSGELESAVLVRLNIHTDLNKRPRPKQFKGQKLALLLFLRTCKVQVCPFCSVASLNHSFNLFPDKKHNSTGTIYVSE